MKRSIWLGYVIAPITAPLLYSVFSLFIPEVTGNKDFSIISWFISVTFFIVASYIACFIFGAVLIFLLKRFKKYTFLWVVVCGSSLYAFSLYALLFPLMGGEIVGRKLPTILYTLLIGFGLGIVVTLVFSMIVGITKQINWTADT